MSEEPEIRIGTHRHGPIVRLPDRGDDWSAARRITIARHGEDVCIYPDECDEVAAAVLAFGNGDRRSGEVADEKSRHIASLQSKKEHLIESLVETERQAQKGLVTLRKRYRAEIAERDVTIMRLRAALRLATGTSADP